MKMDWNWFFSSLAQSTAAIVSIFGAFIIAKILSNQNTFSKKKNRIKELIVSAKKIKDNTSGFEQKTKEEQMNIGIEVYDHTQSIRNLLDSIKGNPESSKEITCALALVTLLFFVGVIFPLSFMPTPDRCYIPMLSEIFFNIDFVSLKGGLLTAISLIFTVTLGMFWVMNNWMKYDNDNEVKELKKLIEPYAYSNDIENILVKLEKIDRQLNFDKKRKEWNELDKKWKEWEEAQNGQTWWGE